MTTTALITGASTGFGVEFARNFAKDGHNLVLVARNTEKLNALAQELKTAYKVEVLVSVRDLSDKTQVDALCDELQTKNITIDYLVNNAGFGDFGDFHTADYAKLEQMIAVNITALTQLCHTFVKPMVAKGKGRILNVASTASFQPGPGMAVYFATKTYVLYLSEAMSYELRKTGVTVTALCPGASITEFQKTANMDTSNLFKDKKLPSAKEVADFGYKKMMRGKMTVIHGLKNRILANANRFSTRRLTLMITHKIMAKSH